MGGRAVEGTGLENRQGWKLFVGSNPTPSAILGFKEVQESPKTLDNAYLSDIISPKRPVKIINIRGHIGAQMGASIEPLMEMPPNVFNRYSL